MFVARKSDGSIFGAWTTPQTEQQIIDGEDNSPDWLADDDPELVAFNAPKESSIAAAKALEDRRADALAETGTVEERLAALELRLKSLGG